MDIKYCCIDLDGTQYLGDLLDILCAEVGTEAESRKLNEQFIQKKLSGAESMRQRVELMKGFPVSQIKDVIASHPNFRPGAFEFISELKQMNITPILYSGNIEPVVTVCAVLLGIHYVVSTGVIVNDGLIDGVDPFYLDPENSKVHRVSTLLHDLGVKPGQAMAIDDSPTAAEKVFQLPEVGLRIGVGENSKWDSKVRYIVKNDLREVIGFLEDFEGEQLREGKISRK